MIESCASCVVRDRTLCSSLTNHELAILHRVGRRQRLAPGATLMWAGGDNLVCGNLLSGVLKLVASTTGGREQIVGLLFPADFVGRPYAEQSEFTVTAVNDVELCVFPRAPFEKALENHSQMEHMLLKRTLATLDQARNQMLVLARSSASERLARFLVDMLRRAQTTGCLPTVDRVSTIDLPLSRGQIADVLGLTIETVSRQITQLHRDGIIDMAGARSVTIVDLPGLTARAGGA